MLYNTSYNSIVLPLLNEEAAQCFACAISTRSRRAFSGKKAALVDRPTARVEKYDVKMGPKFILLRVLVPVLHRFCTRFLTLNAPIVLQRVTPLAKFKTISNMIANFYGQIARERCPGSLLRGPQKYVCVRVVRSSERSKSSTTIERPCQMSTVERLRSAAFACSCALARSNSFYREHRCLKQVVCSCLRSLIIRYNGPIIRIQFQAAHIFRANEPI